MTSPSDDISSRVEGAEIFAFPRAQAARAASGLADQPRSGSDRSSQSSGADREDAGGGGHSGAGGEDGDLDRRLARYPLTDLGNAERFATRNEKSLRYCPEIGWLWWDGKHWSPHGADEIVKLREHDCVRAIQREADAIRRTTDDYVVKETKSEMIWWSDKIAGWGRLSESAQKLASISKRAAAMLAIDVDRLDADPMKINLLNGTLHIRKCDDGDYVALAPHDSDNYITKLAPVAYEPEALCPLFRQFLDEIQPPKIISASSSEAVGDQKLDRSMQSFLLQWFGYSLTGDVGEQKMVFFYGRGRNGKGVLVNLMSYIAGDYAASVGIETFLDSGRARAGGQATPDLAKLPGVRLLTTSEPKKGASLDEGLVKLVTGGDPIDARHLNKNFFQFKPDLKLTMQGNYRPKVAGTDEGIWNRIVLVPFSVFIPPERRDPHLGEKLKAEASGVLNLLLDGLRLWLDEGLKLPGEVKRATEEYRSDSDPLGRFLGACTEQRMQHRIKASEMHALFCAWAKANGETEWSAKGLGQALKERGIAAKKSDTIWWLDIALTRCVSDFVDADGKPWRQRNEEDWVGGGDDDER